MKMITLVTTLLTFIFSMLLSIACGSKKSPSADDHVRPPAETTELFIRPSDCRAHIKDVVCVVEASSDGLMNRPCVGDASAYVRSFEDIHDELPAHLQKMFCSVQHFYVEKDIVSLAYAQSLYKANVGGSMSSNGVIFGIRESVLQKKVSLQDVMSWKEQKNFTKVESPEFEVKTDLPRIMVSQEKSSNTALYYILVHEFGHFFDFANKISASGCHLSSEARTSTEPCVYDEEGSWGALSWKNRSVLKDLSLGIDNSIFCFYRCEAIRTIPGNIEGLYKSFRGMPFVTTYALSNVSEDFADTFTFYTNTQEPMWQKSYVFADGSVIDLNSRFMENGLQAKREFLRDFVAGPTLLYP